MCAMPTKEAHVPDLAHRHVVGSTRTTDEVSRCRKLAEVLRVHHGDAAPAAVLNALEAGLARRGDRCRPAGVDAEATATK